MAIVCQKVNGHILHKALYEHMIRGDPTDSAPYVQRVFVHLICRLPHDVILASFRFYCIRRRGFYCCMQPDFPRYVARPTYLNNPPPTHPQHNYLFSFPLAHATFTWTTSTWDNHLTDTPRHALSCTTACTLLRGAQKRCNCMNMYESMYDARLKLHCCCIVAALLHYCPLAPDHCTRLPKTAHDSP